MRCTDRADGREGTAPRIEAFCDPSQVPKTGATALTYDEYRQLRPGSDQRKALKNGGEAPVSGVEKDLKRAVWGLKMGV